ncbi:MAG: type VI secretion system baseplate subunit TssK [Limnobacter sp.]|nr:type VI secretion system baseplate subunit TssK [Limnobacter sp.]
MSRFSKVVWSDGLFLQPQHFQQQDRHVTHEIQVRQTRLASHAYGFKKLVLDQELLQQGQIGILEAEGFFEDGTYFQIPNHCPAPHTLSIPIQQAGELVYLVVPTHHWKTCELEREQGKKGESARFTSEIIECSNIHEQEVQLEEVEIAQLKLELRLESEGLSGYMHLPLVQILDHLETKGIVLEQRFIPPALDIFTSVYLLQLIRRIKGLLEQKINLIQSRRLGKTAQTAELGDFLLLQTACRYRHVLQYFETHASIHPEQIYIELLKLLGDASLFHPSQKNLEFTPRYRHRQLRETFESVMAALEFVLMGVSEQRAFMIELVERQFGVRLGQVRNLQLFADCYFVLAVKANDPVETILREFPSTVKMGPPEHIRDLVNLNLPAVALRHLPHPPREMPFYSESVYFRLETQGNALWQQVAEKGNLALHYAGPLNSLYLELWAIRKDEGDGA